MGNCFANCSQSKESSSAAFSNESLSETSSDESARGLSADKKPKNGEHRRIKKVVKKRGSSVVPRKAWTRNRKRVAPCNNDTVGIRSEKTLHRSANFLFRVSGSLDSSVESASSTSLDTESGTSCSLESYQESSSRSSYSESVASTYDDSSSGAQSSYSESNPSMEINPGVTQGRLIIVQPCRSLSGSYNSSSAESIHSACTIRTTGSSSDSSSSLSYSDNLDDSSEDESCKVHPFNTK